MQARVVASLDQRRLALTEHARAAGKILLLEEHAVVYGSRALAVPYPAAMFAAVGTHPGCGVHVEIASWGVQRVCELRRPTDMLERTLQIIWQGLDAPLDGLVLEVQPRMPRGSGVGGSAALAVAVIRALAAHLNYEFDLRRVNALAFACERCAHGTPSGVDNTVATYEKPLLFRRGTPPELRQLQLRETLQLVLAHSGVPSMTAEMVTRVRTRRNADPTHYDAIFTEIDDLTARGTAALEAGDLRTLGAAMERNHALLVDIGVSHPHLETLVSLSRAHGALGAKLTGAGGGGAMVALCTGDATSLLMAMRGRGFAAELVNV